MAGQDTSSVDGQLGLLVPVSMFVYSGNGAPDSGAGCTFGTEVRAIVVEYIGALLGVGQWHMDITNDELFNALDIVYCTMTYAFGCLCWNELVLMSVLLF